ncbi:MAG: DVUA0089 family protein [Cyanobacteria bacterium P01_F01_bin.143]
MVQASLSTSTSFDGDLNALVEDQGTEVTFRVDLDEAAPSGGTRVYIDSETVQIFNRLDLPAAVSNPQIENVNLLSVRTNIDDSGLAFTINQGATFATITLAIFDNLEPDTFLPETFDGRVDATFSLLTEAEIDPVDLDVITVNGVSVSDVTIDPEARDSVVIFVDDESQLPDSTIDPPSDALQVSLFTGPDYLIEDEGTVSAHAFLVTNGVIPEGGLVVSVNAPNLSEFDLTGVSVEGGEIIAVRDGDFDLLMTEYTTLVNLPIADDGETETGETGSFSLAAGDGYEIVTDYSGGSFNLVDTRSDIPSGEVDSINNIIPLATETNISPENPNFSGESSIYFDIGNRYLNEDGTYTYIDYSEDVDIYRVELSAGDTIAIETFEVPGNPNPFGFGLDPNLMIFDAEGNRARDFATVSVADAPDKLFGGNDPSDPNSTDSYNEFTAPQDGVYYVALSPNGNLSDFEFQQESNQPIFNALVPGLGNGDRPISGNYRIAIDLITEDNPRNVGTPTPPVSNPGVTNPPTFSLSATPLTTDGEGNVTPAVVESVEVDGVSDVTFTIQAEGEVPEGGLEFVLNSDVNLFDYLSFLAQEGLPSTIGGQFLGAFYNEEGIPTGFQLRIDEPIMTLNYQSANNRLFPGFLGNVIEALEPLETDGPEDVTFFIQPGEGYEVAPDAGTVEVTYYDSLEDVPDLSGGGETGPEVGVTISETQLIETEGTETTLTFNLSEAPPPEGVTVFFDSDQDPIVGSALSQFAVLEAEVNGGDFPISNGDRSGFFFTITEQTASITLPVFDELSVEGINPFAVQEGLLELNFALQPQPGYTIDSDASEISVTIADNPGSQIQVTLTNLDESGDASPPLIESEGTVSIHTFNVSATVPAEGLTVSVSADSLSDFDLDAVEVAGGSIAAVREDGFDLTITEQTAVISLPVLDDGIAEGSETATFTLEPGDNYETNQELVEAIFILSDTVSEVSVPSEIEDNDILADANALGLTLENPATSLSGLVGDQYYDPSEDVDFFSFDLEAGQTVLLDIDSSEWNVLEEIGFPVLFPALNEVQLPDTELRLFDAAGNELASNNDGAAPGEDFSRDPYLEFTAEIAGTYYLGVSQLGNDNYDPNTARSGSGWTFPEVGVFYGPYELTATLEDATTTSLLDTPISRFQNSDLPGTYLYATGEEADSIRASSPNFVEEGVAFNAAIAPDDELIVLNRFQNSDLPGTYLYAGEEESQSIRANFPNFIEEGPGFYAYGAGAGEETPFNRFQNSDVPGTYLYATGAEADSIRANFPNFIDEGIAFEAAI